MNFQPKLSSQASHSETRPGVRLWIVNHVGVGDGDGDVDGDGDGDGDGDSSSHLSQRLLLQHLASSLDQPAGWHGCLWHPSSPSSTPPWLRSTVSWSAGTCLKVRLVKIIYFVNHTFISCAIPNLLIRYCRKGHWLKSLSTPRKSKHCRFSDSLALLKRARGLGNKYIIWNHPSNLQWTLT